LPAELAASAQARNVADKAAEVSGAWSWAELLGVAWCLGFVVMVVRELIAGSQLRRLRKQAVAADAELATQIAGVSVGSPASAVRGADERKNWRRPA